MQFELYNKVSNNSESISQLLGEPPIIAQERERLAKTLETLKKATKVLKRDPE